MTRKDFELIAGVLREARPMTMDDGLFDYLAHAFVEALTSTNPDFNRDRFLRAAGVED